MESDFVTRQHIDSLTPASDPGLSEILNNYRYPPLNPQPQPQPQPQIPNLGGVYPVPFFAGQSGNDMLLGNILGQLQANQTVKKTDDGFQLNISTEILRWLILIILLAVLIWVIFKVQANRKNPLKRRLKRLEKEMKRLRSRRKNPKALKLEDDLDELSDDVLDDI